MNEQPDLLAAYMVGHGPYREPRPLELQWMRIERYRNLLAEKDQAFRCPVEPYMDLNYPRASIREGENQFPALYRLLKDAEQGCFRAVLIDIAGSAGWNHDYTWIESFLESAGLRVANAYYDSEGVLENLLQHKYGGLAHSFEITDGLDFITFFPALASEIASDALRRLHNESFSRSTTANDRVWNELNRLREKNPYSAGKEPFLSEELTTEWFCRQQVVEKAKRPERLSVEPLFKLAPEGPGLLVDDPPRGWHGVRDSEGLKWAEDRVQQFGFQKTFDESASSFTLEYEGTLVFADIRPQSEITFYVYALPEDARRVEPSQKNFSLQDRFTRNLGERWNSEFRKVISMSRR